MTHEFQGKLADLKERVQGRWNTITDRDFEGVGENVDQLVSVIEQKSGVTRQAIEDFLSTIVTEGQSLFGKATSAVREQVSNADEAIKGGYDKVRSTLADGYHLAGSTVRRNPVESIAISFGVGLLTGAMFGYVLSRSR